MMSEEEKIVQEPRYFSAEELRRLKELESQQITKVLFHYWINAAKTNDIIELLNYIEFRFIDNTSLTIAASDLCDCLEIKHVDIEAENIALLEKFKGQIKLQTINKTNDELWSRIIGYPVEDVMLDNNGANRYYSDRVLLTFLPLNILIAISPMGIEFSETSDQLN